MIPIYEPDLSGNERRYLIDAFDSTWISSKGAYIDRFEAAISAATGIPHVAAVSNGTVALHLALHCLDLKPGDEVIVPSFTYIASVNTIAQTGATPVFAEVKRDDWLLDPDDVVRRITPRTRAILVVHLFGAACDMPAFQKIARDHKLALVEDCAEALGTTFDGVHVGNFGTVATFSFFGNKTVTTGEGGMVGSTDADLNRRMAIVKGQGQDPKRRYWHIELGFNYRMTNLCAAIGLAQTERLSKTLQRKRAIADQYRRLLANAPVEFQKRRANVENSEWLISILLPIGTDRDGVMAELADRGVETRPLFYCAHEMPHYAHMNNELPISQEIASRGISLPSFPTLTDDQICLVCSHLVDVLSTHGRAGAQGEVAPDPQLRSAP